MKKNISRMIALLLTGGCLFLISAAERVSMQTNFGTIVIELDSAKAPKTVANFLKYVDAGFYSETIFHRVIDGFMIQGGGFTKEIDQKATNAAVTNEADNGLKNFRGTVAMARTGDPHSATGQFFINLKDNNFLDHTGKTQQGWGYCVFGKVVTGMKVVDSIAKTPTTTKQMPDMPAQQVIIKKVSREKAPKK